MNSYLLWLKTSKLLILSIILKKVLIEENNVINVYRVLRLLQNSTLFEIIA